MAIAQTQNADTELRGTVVNTKPGLLTTGVVKARAAGARKGGCP